ncbi:MAG: glycine cleavage system aminomethyltransferase GcvT [Gammaproteobacteria bacterium]
MPKRTPLYEQHVAMGGKLVEFAGWEMPIHYGSQLEEHHLVRRAAGMFDVSHMTVIDLEGADVRPYLRRLLANNVDRLTTPGKALYTCMLNQRGGVIDDLIVYFMREDWFRMVVNAATHDKDLAWVQQQAADFGVQVIERAELAMIAVQGPNARDRVYAALGDVPADGLRALRPFHAAAVDDLFVARTGYTGEDGFEIILPAQRAAGLWQALHEQGVAPIGLGARDTLRLEAGMNLYGSDMDEDTTPLESGLGWTVGWEPQERDFIGRAVLDQQREDGEARKLVGLVLEGRGVLRGHQKVMVEGVGEGEITSGSFAPTLGRSIGLARVPAGTESTVAEDIRGKPVAARVVEPPFVRHGKSCLPEGV